MWLLGGSLNLDKFNALINVFDINDFVGFNRACLHEDRKSQTYTQCLKRKSIGLTIYKLLAQIH